VKIVKQGLIGLLALSMLISAFLVPLVYLDYNLRKDYISEVLCINKAKPMTLCDGQCYLKKQLDNAQTQQDEEKSLSGKLELNFINQFPDFINLQSISDDLDLKFGNFIESFWIDPYQLSVFQPPQSV
jgi:hypothetical protein